jgi:hypothetical protein
MNRKLLLGTVASMLSAAFAGPDGSTILKALETNETLSQDVHSQVSLTETRPGQGAKAMRCEYYRRDSDKSFVVLMTAPESDRGNGYFRQGEHFWMYRRNTRTFQHVNRDESIGGSDARGQDFESRPLTQMYAPVVDAQGKEALRADTVGGLPCWRLEVRAIISDVDYPRKTFWVHQSDLLLAKDQSFSTSGTLMHSGYYTNYRPVASRMVPMRQVHVDEVEKGNRTLMDLSEVQVGKQDPKIFTKAWIESQSK